MAKFYTLCEYLHILHLMPKHIRDNGDMFELVDCASLLANMTHIGDNGEIFDEKKGAFFDILVA